MAIVTFETSGIVNLVNILLALMLGILCLRYTKFHSHLSEFWKRILALAYIFILSEVAEFINSPLIAAAGKTLFAIYFIYLISYLTPHIKQIQSAEEEIGLLKKRLTELKVDMPEQMR